MKVNAQPDAPTWVDELMSRVNDEMETDDSGTPMYQWAQQISSVVSKAQGGKGPFRDRYLDIAVLAIRAIRAIDGAK